MKVVDASECVMGRLASRLSKELLKGETISVVNAEKALIIGHKWDIIKKYKKRTELQQKGNPLKGPKYPKQPEGILRRSVRGMLPYKRANGKAAYKRLKVYGGVPVELKEREAESYASEGARAKKGVITLSKLSKVLGGRG